MESKYNIKEIITQVGDIAELISRMKADGPVPMIEIDIVLDKIRILYADVSSLKEAKPPIIQAAAVIKEEPAAIKQEEPVKKPDVKEAVTGEPSILADKFKGEKKFINETLADNGKRQNLSSKLQSKPIHNIGKSLGLNDRFTLINELFNGDKESYHQTINVLDSASNFNEAFNYINSSYDWDMEDDSVQMLLDLVRRKFIVNKNE